MLKVSSIVLNRYKKFCPTSTDKSNNKSEIEMKIRRAVDLGKTIYKYGNGSRIVRYYHLHFLTDDKEVMTMWFSQNKYFKVSENDKEKWTNEYYANHKGWFKRIFSKSA